MAGDRILRLQSKPINWQIGDKLVLTGTRYISTDSDKEWESTIEDEEVTIKAIKGNIITLEETLKYNHNTPRADLKAFVANQTRNVVIKSENGESTPLGQRGHAMFMHSNDIDIRYAQFQDLGRTSKRKAIDSTINGRKNENGRYAFHIHKTGASGDPAIVVGNAIGGSPGWGYVLHDSSGIFQNNVAYDVDGSAFVTESGNETGAFRNNISIKTGGIYGYNEKSGVSKHDFGKSGIGFWFAGRLVENEGNVAAGSRNAGMFYMHRGSKLIRPDAKDLPLPDAARDTYQDGTVHVDHAPIQGFKDNEVLASSVGLHVVKDFPKQHNDLRTVLDGFKGWEVESGTHLQYTSHYTLNNFDLVGSKNARFWRNKGVDLQRNTQDILFNKMTIDGFKAGIAGQELKPGQGVPILDDRDLIWIDLKLKGNEADFDNFTLPKEDWLTNADINSKAQLKFTPSDDIDLEITGDDFKDDGYVQIKGTKTDSLGTVEMPFGDEQLTLNYHDASTLAKKGYYTLPDGRRAAIVQEYFSDRVTGETIKQPFVVTFKDSFWTNGAPNLGTLNPNSIGGPQKVTLPKSKFQLSTGPIKPVGPLTPPTGPTTGPDKPLLQSIASYGFDAGNGSKLEDESTLGNDNSGWLRGGAKREKGLKGNGLKLDGKGRAQLNNTSDINQGIHGERSVSLWFKADSTDNGKQVLYEEGGATRGLNAYIEGDDLYIGGWNRDRTQSGWKGSWIAAENSITTGQWHHVALVLDGDETIKEGALTAYLDGEKIADAKGSQLWSHGDRIALGNIANKTRFHDGIGSGAQGLDGILDEVNIYNESLSGEQVKELHSLFG